MKLFMSLVLLLTFGACASKEAAPVAQAPQIVETTTESKKDIAYDGHCGMGPCLKKKVKGDTKYGVDYKGKTYLFSSAEARDKFLSNIDKNIAQANKQWQKMGSNNADKIN